MADEIESHPERPVRASQLRLCKPPTPASTASGSSCELVLWVEGRWRCEVWFVEGLGQLRLYQTRQIVFDIPIRDSEAAVDQAVRWLGAVMKSA